MIKIRAVREPWYAGVQVLICEVGLNGELKAFAEPITMRTLAPHEQNLIIEKTLHIQDQSAQQLMDELWHCGFRPTDGTGSAGSLKATERHLEDMRRLVFKENQ